MEFTDDEIREELARLGYHNVPYHRLQEFKSDLSALIEEERSRSESGDSYFAGHHVDDSYRSEPYRREYRHSTGRYSPRYDKENYRTKTFEDRRHGDYSNVGRHSPPHEFSYVRPASSHVPSYHRRDYDEFARPVPRSAWGEADQSPSKDSVVSESNTSTNSERRVIKRKVLRKHDGKSRVFNESIVTESDPDDLGVSRLSDRLRNVRVLNDDTETESVSSRGSTQSRPRQYFRSSMPTSNEDANKKAVIVPTRAHPHTKNVRKSDPVSRYHQTQQTWKLNKAPGEKKHKDLRWSVREQMLYHDEVVKKPPRVFVPNSYVVPTDKKRKALVWQVRADMAKGNKPPVGGFTD